MMPDQAARVEKVKLRDIKENPFRDFKISPLREEAIAQLKTLIKENGWHDNLIGRKKDGNDEIAFGHHRVEALRQLYGDDYEIDITISNLTDLEMIQQMAGDNDLAFNSDMRVIDNDVSAIRKYLHKHPEEQRAVLTSEGQEDKRERIKLGAPRIAKVLEKKLSQVQLSVERLNAIENGLVDEQALHLLPTAATADIFIEILKEYRIEKKYQLGIVKKIVMEKSYNKNSMEFSITQSMLGYTGKYSHEYWITDYTYKKRIQNFSGKIITLNVLLSKIRENYDLEVLRLKKTITDVVPAKNLKEFRNRLIGLNMEVADTIKFLNSTVPKEAWNQPEPIPTIEEYKAKLAEVARKHGGKAKLHPGQLRKHFGLHKQRTVEYRAYTLDELPRMVKEGKFYY